MQPKARNPSMFWPNIHFSIQPAEIYLLGLKPVEQRAAFNNLTKIKMLMMIEVNINI